VHGAEETRRVIAASQAAFGQAEPAQLDKRLWKAMAEELPHVTYRPGFASHGAGAPTMLSQVPSASEQVGSPHAASTFSAGAPSIASLMVSAGTAPTLSDARRAIAGGGVYLNNRRVASENQVLTDDDLFYDRYAFVRRGKRTVAIVEKMDD
jgi:tyrosyl-tRNA synthetase